VSLQYTCRWWRYKWIYSLVQCNYYGKLVKIYFFNQNYVNKILCWKQPFCQGMCNRGTWVRGNRIFLTIRTEIMIRGLWSPCLLNIAPWVKTAFSCCFVWS